jgi:hypothetical protein
MEGPRRREITAEEIERGIAEDEERLKAGGTAEHLEMRKQTLAWVRAGVAKIWQRIPEKVGGRR